MRYLLGVEDWESTVRRIRKNAEPVDDTLLVDAYRRAQIVRQQDDWSEATGRRIEQAPDIRVEAGSESADGYPGMVTISGLVTPQPIVSMERVEQVAQEVRDGADLMAMAFPEPPYPFEVEVSSDRHKGCSIMAADPNIVVADIEWRRDPGFEVVVKFRKASPVLTVMEMSGRYIVRNGVHRIVGFAMAGIKEFPAFVVPVRSWPSSPGLFTADIVLGDFPPRIEEFLKIGRYVDVPWKSRTRMWRVIVDEFLVPWTTEVNTP